MPTIRVDNDVYQALQERAEPFVDTPNSVVRRILGLATSAVSTVDKPENVAQRGRRPRGSRKAGSSGSKRQGRSRMPSNTLLSEAEYEVPLLSLIQERGGRAQSREVIEALGERLKRRLTDADRQELASGGVRWRNRAQFVRLRLVERGDLKKGSPRGFWEISEQGRLRVDSQAQ